MTAKLLLGEQVAACIMAGVENDISALKTKGQPPHLVALMVGDNPGSRVYLKQQKKTCEGAGVRYSVKEMPATSSEESVLQVVDQLNQDRSVTGVILMMPMPEGIDGRKVQMRISTAKDVEGQHPANMGKLVYGEIGLAPCTARAAMEILKSTGVDFKGKETVIVGHSEIVGKPLALMLLASRNESATPTVCHIATKDLAFHTRRADILFVAAGKAGLIKGDMVKEGAIVIDIGINRVPDLGPDGKQLLDTKGQPKKKTVGDVDFEGAKARAGMITPVPGGVGVVTAAILLQNTILCAKLASGV